MSPCPGCGCDPNDLTTLGTHGGADCVNPQCPTGCNEPYQDDDDEAAEAVARAWMFGE